ncbi:MAG: hypothetical protein C0429_18170 [Sphingopyxis sp.]|nr:hypothetical protein [Sphingopyxis sp.]
MSEFPQLEYSKKDVVRAGKALAKRLVWEAETKAEIQTVFDIANSWRASHAFPMHRMRAELHGRMSSLKLKGLTAARLKQMSSIRGKLNRIESNLRQLQDLGGCRAVVPDIQQARQLVSDIVDKSPHKLTRQDHYMDSPRPSGYRSHHIVFAFNPRHKSEEGYEGRLIEMQIRSRLQHSWATAVEAVGLYRGENMKADEGNQDWLRLFQLMSHEFAASEGCDYANDQSNSRAQEIVELDAILKATDALDSLSIAVHSLDLIALERNYKPRYCLIKYDQKNRKVDVSYLNSPSNIGGVLENYSDNEGDSDQFSSVVVELDKIDNLKKAYPNYFGDVQLFKSRLAAVVNGRPVKEYSLPPIERALPPPKETPDDSWLRNPSRRYRRWIE